MRTLFALCCAIIVCFSPLDCAAAAKYELFPVISKTFNGIMEELALEDTLNVNDAVLAKWDAFVSERYGFGRAELQLVMEKIHAEYQNSIEVYEKCCNEYFEEQKKNDSGKWLVDLKSEFGDASIEQKNKRVKEIVGSIYLTKSASYCLEAEKDAVYAEGRFKDAVNLCFEWFTKFVETLDGEERHLMKKKEGVVEELLGRFGEMPIQRAISGNSLRHSRALMKYKSSIAAEPEIADFLIKHPYFSKPFHIFKTLDRLEGKQESVKR